MTDTNKIIVGVLAGLAMGAAIALLLAPEKGSDMREKLSEGISEANDELKDTFAELKTQVGDYIHAFEKDIRQVVHDHLHNLTEQTAVIKDKKDQLEKKAVDLTKEFSN